MDSGGRLAPGDLLAVSCADAAGRRWLLASFHGDSCGRSARPALAALGQLVAGPLRGHLVVLGVDANTRSGGGGGFGCGGAEAGGSVGPAGPDFAGWGAAGSPGNGDRPLARKGSDPMSACAFSRFVQSLGLVSVWEYSDDPSSRATACAQRTLLQAQPHKAVRREAVGRDRPVAVSNGNAATVSRHTKDWVLFGAAHAAAPAQDVGRDNTGERRFDPAVSSGPTSKFPSDHAVVFARLRFCDPPRRSQDPQPLPERPTHEEQKGQAEDAADKVTSGGAAAVPGTSLMSSTASGSPCGREARVQVPRLPRRGLPQTLARASMRWRSLGRNGNGGRVINAGGDLWGLSTPFSSDLMAHGMGGRSESFNQLVSRTTADGSDHQPPAAQPVHLLPILSQTQEHRKKELEDIEPKGESDKSQVTVKALCELDWDPEEQVLRLCKQHFEACVAGPAPNTLDSRNEALSFAMKDRSVWILFGTRPLSLALAQPWTRGLMVMVGSMMLLSAVVSSIDAVGRSSVTATAVRLILSDNKPRNDSIIETKPSEISSFWLLQNGCRIKTPQNVTASQYGPELFFRQTVTFDGLKLKSAAASTAVFDLPPKAWLRLEISSDGRNWNKLSWPPWLQPLVLNAAFCNSSSLNINLRPTASWLLQHSIAPLTFVLGCFVAFIFSHRGRGPAAAKSIAISHLLYGLTFLASASCQILLENQRHGPELFLVGSGSIALSIIMWYERYTVDCYPFVALLMTTALLVQLVKNRALALSDPYEALEMLLPVLITSFSTILGFGFILARIIISRWVFSAFVCCERRAYQSLWNSILAKDYDALSKLSYVTNPKSQMNVVANLRQFYSNKETGKINSCPVTPVQSLDQLYSQAAVVDIFLREKVGLLAQRSCHSGMVEVRSRKISVNDNEPVQCRDYSGVYLSSKYIFSAVKPTERALEKLLRCYDCDPSRLLDCCRQRIVFDDVEDIIICLQSIQDDPELEILRIKNMMDPQYDHRTTAGFR